MKLFNRQVLIWMSRSNINNTKHNKYTIQRGPGLYGSICWQSIRHLWRHLVSRKKYNVQCYSTPISSRPHRWSKQQTISLFRLIALNIRWILFFYCSPYSNAKTGPENVLKGLYPYKSYRVFDILFCFRSKV